MSQREKVLAALRYAGDRGLNSFWGYQNSVPRLAAIVHSLKQEGFVISSVENGENHSCTYYLVKVPERFRTAADEIREANEKKKAEQVEKERIANLQQRLF